MSTVRTAADDNPTSPRKECCRGPRYGRQQELEAFADRFEYVRWKPGGHGFMARCPVEEHEDNSPSLSVDLAEDGGSLLLYCFGYCEVGVVLDALGLSMRDLFLRTTAKPRPPRQNRQLAKWERVAERAMQQQWLEAQPWYWTYRAALFDWANCPEDARLCEVHADLLGGGR